MFFAVALTILTTLIPTTAMASSGQTLSEQERAVIEARLIDAQKELIVLLEKRANMLRLEIIIALEQKLRDIQMQFISLLQQRVANLRIQVENSM